MKQAPSILLRLGRAVGLFAAVALLLAAGWNFARPLLAAWVAGEKFNRMLSHAVSHALKVEGQFDAMRLDDGFAVTTEGFTSKGWPGQAIGALDTTQATGIFNPWGVLRGVWQVDSINIARADFRLRQPDNALKALDPATPPRPWYAALMPRDFHCGWIECPDMQIELPLGAIAVRGTNLQVGATMIGKNFKYYGQGGAVQVGDFPAMASDGFEVYVTREMIEIGYLYLREPASKEPNLLLAGRLGQHADRSIQARATVTSLDLRPFLPPDIARIISGRLSGQLQYQTDKEGGGAKGQGNVSLEGVRLEGWDYLERLARKAGKPDLARLDLRKASFDYTLAGGRVEVANLALSGVSQIDLRGSGSWDIRSRNATASVSLSRLPVGAYLPASVSGGLGGELSAQADWAWAGTHLAQGRGGGRLELAGGRLTGFKFQQFLARFLRDDAYLALDLARAACRWRQDDAGLHLDGIDVLAAGRAGLRGAASISHDGKLSGTVMAGLPASALGWLPDATKTVFAMEKDGLHWCTIRLSGTEAKPDNDFTKQVLRQLEKHPIALAELALRGLSWWLGDVFEGRRGR